MSPRVKLQIGERTAVLTGAGFSRGVGIPLQDELLESLVSPDHVLLVKALLGLPFDAHLGLEAFLSACDLTAALDPSDDTGLNSKSLR
jgi:hypothetical protein